ncbi:MAG: YkoF family thiamine/hydroxymethylpyrimidine-binding protein [Woeseia sp.]
MRVAVDISLYPLADEFLAPIQDVIARLNTHESLEVLTNPMSTQIRGDYDEVMAALQREMKTTFEAVPKAVFAIRILNNPMAE